MADEEKQEADGEAQGGEGQESEEGAGRKKGILMAGGGFVALLAVAFVLAMSAVPKKHEEILFDGPFVVPLTEEDIQVNVGTEKAKYFVFAYKAVHDAYSETYLAERTADPVTVAYLKDRLIGIAEHIDLSRTSDPDYDRMLREEIRDLVSPLLFPVHVGNGAEPHKPDPESGLAPGLNIERSTFRGPFHSHWLHVDTQKRTLQLDDGPVVTYEARDSEVHVTGSDGETVFIDVTHAEEDFAGSIPIGVQGRIRDITKEQKLFQ